MNDVESLKLLKVTWAMWPTMEIDDIRAAVFHEAIKEESYPESCASVIRLLRQPRSFPPTPGDIIEESRRYRAEKAREEERAKNQARIEEERAQAARRSGRMPSEEQAREIARIMRDKYPGLFAEEEAGNE